VDSLPVELTEGTPGALERKEMLRVLLAGVHRLVTLLARIYRLREREVGEMGGHSVLSSVARTGFCLSTSPRSSFKPSRLQLCARGGGADDWYAPHDPDGAREGGLIEHTPIGVTEVEETARRLEKVLKAELPNPPPCLSVTRSTRDGHTPIESWREYETALIGVVDSLFRKLERETPTRVYDKWLLHPGPAIVSSTEGSAQTDRADLEKILTAAGGESPGGSLAGNQNFFASQPGASPQSLPLSPFVPSRVSTFAEMSLRSL